jgi:hypothetical protein
MTSNDINDSGGSIGNPKEKIEADFSNTGSDDTSSPDFYIQSDTTPEVLAYGSDLPQLEVGRSGKIGALIVKLEDDSDRRKTIVRDLYTNNWISYFPPIAILLIVLLVTGFLRLFMCKQLSTE